MTYKLIPIDGSTEPTQQQHDIAAKFNDLFRHRRLEVYLYETIHGAILEFTPEPYITENACYRFDAAELAAIAEIGDTLRYMTVKENQCILIAVK